MQNENTCIMGDFGPDGSTTHETLTFNFSIDYMNLIVTPDFELKSIDCEQRLTVTTKKNISYIELDSAGLIIKSVAFSNLDTSSKSKNNDSAKEIKSFQTTDDNKLKISFGVEIPSNSTFYLTIKYSAQPKTGFHFIEPDRYYHQKTLHAWTQGEPEDSKYWFPCIDKPQIKFPREISVSAPKEFVVISNGSLVDEKDVTYSKNEGDKEARKVWTWRDENPEATYLTSIAIGKFSRAEDRYPKEDKTERKVDLIYCVPENRRDYTTISFSDTPNIMKFFEKYLDTNYPYNKYAQVVVEDFDYDGMENTSCTTYYEDVLADQKILNDPSDDYVKRNYVITHELAHQWFGDLVTCKDWSHIWLNEGFANYFEALYWESKTKNFDQYQSYILNSAKSYFDEACNSYKRPMVYNFYLDPIDLFDSHAYAKGGCVLHMIRNYVGDENFRKSLKNYLKKYKFKSVETDDLLKTFEETTKQNFHEFFKQWIYSAGHPELSISHNADESAVKIKITQKQEVKREYDIDVFKFPLDIKLVYSFANNNNKRTEMRQVEISEKEMQATFQVPIDETGQQGTLEWFSIDPIFKILKKIVDIDNSKEMLIKQLLDGETVYERVQAIEALSKFSDDSDIINALEDTVLKDNFYRVSVEAAVLLGTYTQSSYAYESIKKCIYSTTDQKIKNELITSIAAFGKEDEELLELFTEILKDDNESYIVQSSAATAIGALIHKRKNVQPYISTLKDTVKTHNGIFKDHVARGAITGIGKLSDNEDNRILSDIVDFLVNNSDYKSGNTNMIRQTATSVLGRFVIQNTDKKIKEINDRVLSHLEHSLRDKWWGTRRSAIAGLLIAFTGKNIVGLKEDDIERALEMLEGVSKADVHAEVRENAKDAIKQIKESQKDPLKIEKTKSYTLKRITQRRLFYRELYR